MPDYLPIARFPLPDDLTPEGTMCVKIRIPADQQYLGTLIGLLDMLKWSANFARDETKLGAATVSRTWQAALESQPIESEACVPFLLRQNPFNPCQLQQSTNGGVSWTIAFDYSRCGAVVTQPPPFIDNPDGAPDAAANVIKSVLQPIAAMAADYCDDSEAAFITAAQAYLRQFNASYTSPALLASIYQQMCALTAPEQAAYQDDDTYCEQFCDLSQCANINGVFDVLDCLNELIVQWLDQANTNLMGALTAAAAMLGGEGLQAAAGFGGEGNGAGFAACPSCDCLEAARWFASNSAWPTVVFEGVNSNYDVVSAGAYEQGTGYTDGVVQFIPTGDYNRAVMLTISAPDMHVTAIKMRIVGTTANTGAYGLGAGIQEIGGGSLVATATLPDDSDIDQVVEWSGDITVDGLGFYFAMGGGGSPSGIGGSGAITYIELCGDNLPAGGTP